MKPHALTEAAFALIASERARQDEKWGHTPGQWGASDFEKACILTEEIGEVARALNDGDMAGLLNELVQVAAVATHWVEVILAKGEHNG